LAALTPPAVRLFRLLGLIPGGEFSEVAAATLAGTPLAEARMLLDTLTAGHLLQRHGPGRYDCHDLIRLYAAGCAAEQEPAAERSAAAGRLLDWYLHTADAADRLLIPLRPRVALVPPAGCTPLSFASRESALAWFEAERTNLVAATRWAIQAGRPDVAWQLPVTLWGFFMLRKYWHDWIATNQVGLAAARAEGDHAAQAWVCSSAWAWRTRTGGVSRRHCRICSTRCRSAGPSATSPAQARPWPRSAPSIGNWAASMRRCTTTRPPGR